MAELTEDDKAYRQALEILGVSYGRTYKSKEAIFAEGDPGQEVFFIVSGAVKIYIGTGTSRRDLWTLWAGEIFGEMALLDQLERTASVETALETKVVALDRDVFNRLIGKYPIVAQKVIELMGKRMRKMDKQFKLESGYITEPLLGQSYMPTGQPPLDGRLCAMQPVQRPIQVIGTALTHPQHAAQRGAGGVVVQQPVCGQLGGRRDHAGHQHRQQDGLQLLGR